jgi:pilus assembly protein CpaB
MLRVLVFGFMGLLLSGVAVVGYVALAPAPPPVPAAARTVRVIAAAREVRAGSLLQPADLTSTDLDATRLPTGAMADVADARERLVGAMLRRSLGERDAVLIEDVLRPGDRGFLAAVLAPGTRAVSVGVDAVSGAAGLIWPGDRVDVILTQTLDAPDQAAGRRVAGETVLGDVRVIAVDQLLVQGGQASNILDGHAPSSRTITLEVSPRDAERIAVATRLGKLQVVLLAARPGPEPTAADLAAPPPIGPITARPVAAGPLAAGPIATGPIATGSIANGPVWGGDVSRALGSGGTERNAEIRLFQGTRAVQTYHF